MIPKDILDAMHARATFVACRSTREQLALYRYLSKEMANTPPEGDDRDVEASSNEAYTAVAKQNGWLDDGEA